MYVGFFNFGNPTDFVNSYNPQTGALITPFFVPVGAAEVIGGIAFSPTNTQVTAVIPNHGGNAGSVTVQVIGGNFQPGAQLKLTGNGPDILGSAAPAASSSVVTATFDLTGAAPGIRNLIIRNPDGTSANLPSSFTVDQGGAPNISVEIIGLDRIRIGQPQTYYVVVLNRGDVDAPPSRIWVTFPTNIAWNIDGPEVPSASGQMTGYNFVAFDVAITANSEALIPIHLSDSTSATFQIQAWRENP